MGMHWVDTNKRRIALMKLIAPLTWFHRDAQEEDVYKFRPNPNARDGIIGYKENMCQYEIFCPPELRDALIATLNQAHKIYIR
jgi:hypothetical protein